MKFLLLLLALALPLPSSCFAFSSHTTRLKPLTLRSTNNFSTRTRSSLRSSYDDEDSSESSSTYFSSTFSSTPSTPATNPASSNDAPFDPTSYGDFGDHVPKLNSVTLVGRIGQTPNPRYFDNGNVVVNVSLAVTRKYHPLERKVRSIQYGSEETDWFPLEIWGRDAEYCAKFVKKGARVGISGQLCMQTWTDKQTGDERKTPRVVVKSIEILETKAEAGLREKNANRGPEENGFWEGGRQTNNDSNNDSNDFFE
ncbi:hypothetical protein TrLO_g10795 [Triparma laevis f. longispina]|uniref:Single-stranded DNA-binding protein n=1 Tax=Triparma laevis f. longispina TaxID=1714387 RepID=A0A9W7FR82_9STRA|nr:hypothetical protein TrLO_g10795 [Triparma laevis f. longispina]